MTTLDEVLAAAFPDLDPDEEAAKEPEQRFVVDDRRKASWAMGLLRAVRERIAERHEEAAEYRERVDAWLESETTPLLRKATFLETLLDHYHRYEMERAIAEGRPEKDWPKTITFPDGACRSTAGRRVIEIEDEAAFVEWARDKRPDLLKMEARKNEIKTSLREKEPTEEESDVVDPDTGEVVPGVKARRNERSYNVVAS